MIVLPSPRQISDDDVVTLAEACEIVFRNKITPSTLRAEGRRGRLAISKIGKRYFTTIRDARELFDRCRAAPEARGSTSTRNAGHGSSETDNDSSAQAAVNQIVASLKKSSPTTLAASTPRSRAHRHG